MKAEAMPFGVRICLRPGLHECYPPPPLDLGRLTDAFEVRKYIQPAELRQTVYFLSPGIG